MPGHERTRSRHPTPRPARRRRREADHVPRAHQPGNAGLPGQLAVEHRGVLHRVRRPHLGEHVARRRPVRRRPPAPAGCRGRSAVGSAARRSRARSRSTARARSTLRRPRPRRIRVVQLGGMHERDVARQEPPLPRPGDRSRRRPSSGRRARGSADPAPAPPPTRPWIPVRTADRRTERHLRRRARGVAELPQPGCDPIPWTRTVRSPESAWARRAASAEPSGAPVRVRSTTVVMPASAAPSSPISVAA